jgi:tRNA(Ile)-lysidine synthase
VTPCAADNGTLGNRFAAALERLGSPLNAPFALAVSGGGDSVALMHLAADWLKTRHQPLDRAHVLTVDHGLRSGSAKEAAATMAWATGIGFAAHTLRWRGQRPRSNVEDGARNARYRLIGDWCRANGIANVLVAHTRDDQAETFLLRLGRGSGVDGLSAMRPRAPYPLPGYDGAELIRPLLDIGRDDLRADLAARGAPFIEDPMNEDPRFARVRIRQALPVLEAAGLSSQRIVQAAGHLARAREALDAATQRFLADHVRFAPAGAFFDGAALSAEPREIGLRALSAILMRVSGKAYRPRFERLEHLYDALGSSMAGLTLSGCRIGPAPKASRHFGTVTLEVRREKSRGHAVSNKDTAQKKPFGGTLIAQAGGKLPKKRRIIGRLSGS